MVNALCNFHIMSTAVFFAQCEPAVRKENVSCGVVMGTTLKCELFGNFRHLRTKLSAGLEVVAMVMMMLIIFVALNKVTLC